MTEASGGQAEGLRMYDELIAVHTIMRRGTALTAAAFAGLAAGSLSDVKTLVSTSRWLTGFVHHHHQSEDELFWPVLRRMFPDALADLDKLTEEHEALESELQTLAAATASMATVGGKAARKAAVEVAASAAPTAQNVHDLLIGHLDTEEPVLLALFPRVPEDEIRRLRKAIVEGAPRSGPDLVFGLLEDPQRPPGYAALVQNFPTPVRWLRPFLLKQYRNRKDALIRSAA